MDLIHEAQERDQWWAVVGMLMSFWVPQNAEHFLIKSIVISFTERCFMELVG